MPKNTTLKKLAKSEVELCGIVTKQDYLSQRAKILQRLTHEAEIKGFRKGHAPETLVIDTVGEQKVKELTLQEIAKATYLTAVDEHQLDPVGQPEVTFKAVDGDSDSFKFVIRTATMPPVSLPNYKKIAAEAVNNFTPLPDESSADKAKDGELEDKEVQRLIAKWQESHENQSPPSKEEAKDWVLRAKIQRQKDKRRLAIIDALVKETALDIPSVLVTAELVKMRAELKAEVERLGANWEQYLSHLKKTEEEITSLWREPAVKRISAALIISAIAQKEGVKPPPEIIDAESKIILQSNPNAREDHIRHFVSSRLVNEYVLQFLENQAESGVVS